MRLLNRFRDFLTMHQAHKIWMLMGKNIGCPKCKLVRNYGNKELDNNTCILDIFKEFSENLHNRRNLRKH